MSVQLYSRRGQGCVDSTRQDGKPRRQVSVPSADPLTARVPSESVFWGLPEDGLCPLLLATRAGRAELHTVLYEPVDGPWLCRLGAVSMVQRAQEVCFGCLGGQQGLKAPGMGHGYGAGVELALLLALEDLQGGEGGTPPWQLPALSLWRTGADPRSSAVLHGRQSVRGKHWRCAVAVDSGDAVAPPFRRGAPSWACTRTPPNVAPDGRESVRDESRPATLSHVKSVQSIK